MRKYFKIQSDFQKKLYDLKKFSYEEKVKITKDFILSAHKELSEILDCFNWKSHRKEDKRFTLSNLGEELIDAFKYIINICIVWGIEPKDFEKFFDDKTAVVNQRHKQEFFKSKKNEKVCAIDLDDVLNEWEKYIVKTYNNKYKTNYRKDREIRDRENTLKYEDFKHWWRESGIKIKIPAKEGASRLTRYLKTKGFRIVIISSRPYRDYSRMFPDTISWLKNNKIVYDDIYFDENKHLTILRHFPKLKFMIENDARYALQVAREGCKVYLLKNPSGKENYPKEITMIQKLDDIKKYVK